MYQNMMILHVDEGAVPQLNTDADSGPSHMLQELQCRSLSVDRVLGV